MGQRRCLAGPERDHETTGDAACENPDGLAACPGCGEGAGHPGDAILTDRRSLSGADIHSY
jgi:hypothetical protein